MADVRSVGCSSRVVGLPRTGLSSTSNSVPPEGNVEAVPGSIARAA